MLIATIPQFINYSCVQVSARLEPAGYKLVLSTELVKNIWARKNGKTFNWC